MGLDRVRSNPKLAVAIACGVLLLLAWIAWAIVVTNNHGSRAGLGVILAWPAAVGVLALIFLPFYLGYLVLQSDSTAEDAAPANPAAPQAEEEEPDEEKPEVEEPAKG